jgi:hypothetical protein
LREIFVDTHEPEHLPRKRNPSCHVFFSGTPAAKFGVPLFCKALIRLKWRSPLGSASDFSELSFRDLDGVYPVSIPFLTASARRSSPEQGAERLRPNLASHRSGAGWVPMRVEPLTSQQIRAARALLRWRAQDLARASAVGVATIRRAELAEGETSMTAPNDMAVRRALEAAGVEFIDENGGGPGVRLRKRQRKKD